MLTDLDNPTAEHRHAAVQVVVSLGEPTGMQADGGPWQRCRGTVVASDVPHAYDSGLQPTLGLWVDPAAPLGRLLAAQVLGGRPMGVLDPTSVDRVVATAPDPPDTPMDASRARAVFEEAAAAVTGDRSPDPAPLDPRVEAVLHRIEGETHLPPVADLASAVELSTSRLQHLVREQLGMPLSRWVLWRRTLRGLEQLAQGATPSQAAYTAGFADAADFGRRFSEFLGASPVAAVSDPRARIVVASRLDTVAA